jgi:uncharacterized membrane protein YfbV (UPF0208 family)
MAFEQKASEDFDRALSKAFWRRVVSRLTGETNALLPFDEVRAKLPMRGQHYIGLRQVPISQIIGSAGRYKDFDRAFLPVRDRTRARWESIDLAHYTDVILPPVELYKMGEVYFVKDGNHRVSVARERGQVFIDAYVIEIDIPVPLTPDMDVDKAIIENERADFLEQTSLLALRPEAQIATSVPGQYRRILEHIAVHRWYLGEKRKAEVPYSEAVESWYDNVYQPLVELIREQGVLEQYPRSTETDLYLWILEYQGYLRQAYRDEAGSEEIPIGELDAAAKAEAGKLVAEEFPVPPVRKLVNALKKASWLDEVILKQEGENFQEKTHLNELYPNAQVVLTVPGQYERLLEHIDVHRWYLGEKRGAEVPYPEAVASWYEHVYCPLVEFIREQGILKYVPGRTEADLYLWIISHKWSLSQEFGKDILSDKPAEQRGEDYPREAVKEIVKAVKKGSRRK